MPKPETIPLVRKELDLAKREVETARVRVRKLVERHEELIEEPLVRHDVEVERVPVNRMLDAPAATRQDGDVLVVPVLEEVVVVQKRWLLKEELRIRRRETRTAHRERVSLREERVVVEREERDEGEEPPTQPNEQRR